MIMSVWKANDGSIPSIPSILSKKSEFCRFQTLNLRSWRSWDKISIFCRAVFHHESSSGGKCAQRCAVWNIWLQTWLSQDHVAWCRMLSHVTACHCHVLPKQNSLKCCQVASPHTQKKRRPRECGANRSSNLTSLTDNSQQDNSRQSYQMCSRGTTLQQPANGCVKHTRTSWCDKWPWDLHGGIGSHQTGLVNISQRSIRNSTNSTSVDCVHLQGPVEILVHGRGSSELHQRSCPHPKPTWFYFWKTTDLWHFHSICWIVENKIEQAWQDSRS